jgi:alpha-glucosidase
LKLRYRLLPFLYTTLEEAHRTGVPLFRPLVLNYQNDASTYNLDDEFMIGEDLLVAPVLRPDVTRRMVYLPEGKWYDYWTNKEYKGGSVVSVDAPLETVPMFVRGGSILPLGPEMNYVGEKIPEPSFVIYPDERGEAATSLYEDDGLTPEYANGVYRRTSLRFSGKQKQIQISIRAPEGKFRPQPRTISFVISTTLSPGTVLLDRQPIPRAADGGTGWFKSGGTLVIRIPDDGRAHNIEIQ